LVSTQKRLNGVFGVAGSVSESATTASFSHTPKAAADYLSPMNIADAYTHWSDSYDSDRNLTRDLDAAVVREVLADWRGASAVELGCGTGKNTGWLAARAWHLTALDFSAGMLAKARARVTAANVAFTQTDLTQPWPVPDASADLVMGNLVLEHIEYLPHIAAEAARVLRPGGRLVLCELHPFKQYLGSKARFEVEGGATVEIPAFVHHVSDYLTAARAAGLTLRDLREWWHPDDRSADTGAAKPPRLLSGEWER
jgi:ubiquinone/menaquinone biosynthesis C-methylase UbiE